MSGLHKTGHPILVLVRGIPGSGKSYLAHAIKAAIGEDAVVTLDPDATDYSSPEYLEHTKALTAEGVEEKFHPYRFVRGKAHRAIAAHKIIVWNQAFTNFDGLNKTIINLQAYAKEQGTTLPVLVVEVEVDADIAKARIAERAKKGGHDVPEETFNRFINDYTSFADKFTTVIVNGNDGIETSVSAVIKALERLAEK